LFYQDDQISFFPAPFCWGAASGDKVREKREKSPRKTENGLEQRSANSGTLHRCGFGGFVAVEMLISLGQGWWS
jgi:uncharacterized protein YgiB involved in biofilm formation